MTQHVSEAAPAAVSAAAIEEAAPRLQLRIARGLAVGFGGLVLLAVVAVLALGLGSAQQNTLDLLADRSASTAQLVVWLIKQYLRPAADLLEHLGRQMEAGLIDVTDETAVRHILAGSLAAAQIKDLSLGTVNALPASVFSGVTAAAGAFNSLVAGLRWFET